MFFPRNGKLNELEYECYHALIDEQEPLWDKEIAEMQKLYLKDGNADKDCPLKKYDFLDIDNDEINEVWMCDKDERISALFTFKDRKPQLIGVETGKMKASFFRANDNKGAVRIAGPAGGASYATEFYVLRKSQVVDRFFMMELEGEITEAELNGKTLTKWELPNSSTRVRRMNTSPISTGKRKNNNNHEKGSSSRSLFRSSGAGGSLSWSWRESSSTKSLLQSIATKRTLTRVRVLPV